MSKADPFYDVKRKTENWWASISAHYQEYQDLKLNDATPQDISAVVKIIKEGIRAINVDLKDLQQTILIVESARAKFPAIDDEELNQRKSFVSEMKVQVKQVKEAITAAKTARQSEEATHQQLMASESEPTKSTKPTRTKRSAPVADEPVADTSKGDDYVAQQQQQQQAIIDQQDDVLVDIQDALANLTDMADGINTQLRDHQVLIADLDNNLTTAQDTMTMVNKKLQKLLGTSDKGRLCCILILFIAVILLFVGIVYSV